MVIMGGSGSSFFVVSVPELDLNPGDKANADSSGFCVTLSDCRRTFKKLGFFHQTTHSEPIKGSPEPFFISLDFSQSYSNF